MNTASMYLSEARSMVPPSTYPRLHSLRSFSLGLLRASLSEAVSHCGAWRMGINTTPTWGIKPARDENRYRVKLRRAHKIFRTPKSAHNYFRKP